MGSEAKTYEGIKVLILASYPAISGISQNKIQGIEKNIGSIYIYLKHTESES